MEQKLGIQLFNKKVFCTCVFIIMYTIIIIEHFLIYKLLTPQANRGLKPNCPEKIARAQISQMPEMIFDMDDSLSRKSLCK